MDRFGFMRPTFLQEKENIVEKKKWRTPTQFAHWDMNPWKLGSNVDEDFNRWFFSFFEENNGNYTRPFKVQGLVALTDCTEKVGGFQAVVGYHHYVKQWAQENPTYGFLWRLNYTHIMDQEIIKNLSKIPVRAGSLIIWDSRLPHCSFNNHSKKYRMVQYIKMFEAKDHAPKSFIENRRKMVKKLIPGDMKLSNREKKLLGLMSYGDDVEGKSMKFFFTGENLQSKFSLEFTTICTELLGKHKTKNDIAVILNADGSVEKWKNEIIKMNNFDVLNSMDIKDIYFMLKDYFKGKWKFNHGISNKLNFWKNYFTQQTKEETKVLKVLIRFFYHLISTTGENGLGISSKEIGSAWGTILFNEGHETNWNGKKSTLVSMKETVLSFIMDHYAQIFHTGFERNSRIGENSLFDIKFRFGFMLEKTG